jgi:phosphate transport system permease protein
MIEAPSVRMRRRPALLLERLFGDVALQSVAVVVVVLALIALGALLYDVFADGWDRLNWQFLTSFPSRRPAAAGIYPALVGTFYLVGLTTILALPVGVAAAIYLEEYGKGNRLARIIEINIANLAGVPSIIYGLLGLGLFVRTLGFGRSVLAGASTMALLVLPIVILSTREALRTVPKSMREGSYALGATKWQTIWHQVLPSAMPGLFTGLILALSRAIGETAPLITIGALTYVPFAPDSIWSPFTVLPIQIFDWLSRPQVAFSENAAAGIIVLLVMLLAMNSVAIVLRDRLQRNRG